MNIRKIKKRIKKLDCRFFKRNALRSLRKIQTWSSHESSNRRSNMKILTKNFMINGKFINN